MEHPQIVRYPVGHLGPTKHMVPWAHIRHLNRFSCFSTWLCPTDKHIHRPHNIGSMQCNAAQLFKKNNNFSDTAQKTGQAGSNEATSDWTKADFLCEVLKKSREDAASNCSNIWSRCRGCTRWPAISDGSVETNKRPPYLVETLPTQGITWPEHRHQAECLLIRHFDIQPLRCYSNYKLKESILQSLSEAVSVITLLNFCT